MYICMYIWMDGWMNEPFGALDPVLRDQRDSDHATTATKG